MQGNILQKIVVPGSIGVVEFGRCQLIIPKSTKFLCWGNVNEKRLAFRVTAADSNFYRLLRFKANPVDRVSVLPNRRSAIRLNCSNLSDRMGRDENDDDYYDEYPEDEVYPESGSNGATTMETKSSTFSSQQLGSVENSEPSANGIWKTCVTIATSIVLVGAFILADRKVKDYLNRSILPSAAVKASKIIGREIKFGPVRSLSPLGVNLGRTFVGPAMDEFSCAEVEQIQIKIRYLNSLIKRQLSLDLIANNPHVLVAQLPNWTWLDIPADMDEHFKRTSEDPGLDERTRVRRKSREDSLAEAGEERAAMARLGAERRYRSFVVDGRKAPEAQESEAVVEMELNVDEWMAGIESQRVWVEENVLRPLKGGMSRFVGAEGEQGLSSSEEVREKLLETSAVAALCHFDKLEAAKNGSEGSHAVGEAAISAVDGKREVSEGQRNTAASDEEEAARMEPGQEQRGPLEEGNTAAAAYKKLPSILGSSSPPLKRQKPRSRKPKRMAVPTVKVELERIFFNQGTLLLVGFGDLEHRCMEETSGWVELSNNYRKVSVLVDGKLKEWRTGDPTGDGGDLQVTVEADLDKKDLLIAIRGKNLFVPLFERLLEIPLDWFSGRANGELFLFMDANDKFPKFKGRVDLTDVDFQIWESPSPFTGVSGSLLFEGEKMFFHDTRGQYGDVPLSVSGDMDLNPVGGEYRLSAKVSGVEVNDLMHTLGAKPTPYPLAGALSGVVHCQGPLDIPTFEGQGELRGEYVPLALGKGPGQDKKNFVETDATRALQGARDKGTEAVGAYDKVPFLEASASFSFTTDDCVANVFGIRLVPVGGGLIRGAGTLWVCPEGELDSSSVNVDCWAEGISAETVMGVYAPPGMELPDGTLGQVHGEARVRGALLIPTIEASWRAPLATSSLEGAQGQVSISRSALHVSSSALAFELEANVDTAYPTLPPVPATRRERRALQEEQRARPRHLSILQAQLSRPTVQGLQMGLELKKFDLFGLGFNVNQNLNLIETPLHARLCGKFKIEGRVKNRPGEGAGKVPGLEGEVSMHGLKLNQLLVAMNLQGSFSGGPEGFQMRTNGRADEQLCFQVDGGGPGGDPGGTLLLRKGALRADLRFEPGVAAHLKVRSLQLDELELASLRGSVERVDMALNFAKRQGSGSLFVKNPRFSGLQCQSLAGNFRWTGDVVTLERSVLQQSISKYILEGEYVLPGVRDRAAPSSQVPQGGIQPVSPLPSPGEVPGDWAGAGAVEGEKLDMASQLRSMISSMGRWRLHLEVPRAEVSEMLPAARLLLRSRDPEVITRSKELFLRGVQNVSFITDSLGQQLEYLHQHKPADVASPEPSSPATSAASEPSLPGLAELKGEWHGTVSARGGGNGDTKANFDLQGESWEWGTYPMQEVEVSGDYTNHAGLRLEKVFLRHNTATLHVEGTLLGPTPNLHFAVLHFPANLVGPLLEICRGDEPPRATSLPLLPPMSPEVSPPRSPLLSGIIFVEGDYRGSWSKPQCEVTVQLLDGSIGGVSLDRAEVATSLASSSRLAFKAYLKPSEVAGEVRVQGSVPFSLGGDSSPAAVPSVIPPEEPPWEGASPPGGAPGGVELDLGDEVREAREGVRLLLESARALERGGLDLEKGAVEIDAVVKDGGMSLLTALSPGFQWDSGSADVNAEVRGTFGSPEVTAVATFSKASISVPVLNLPLESLGGRITVQNREIHVEGLEGRVGKKGALFLDGVFALSPQPGDQGTDPGDPGEGLTLKTESLEVRAKNVFSGQVDSSLVLQGTLQEPQLTGLLKLSRGIIYLSQEKAAPSVSLASEPAVDSMGPLEGPGGLQIASAGSGSGGVTALLPYFTLPSKGGESQSAPNQEPSQNQGSPGTSQSSPLAPPSPPSFPLVLSSLRVALGPDMRIVYPVILNMTASGEVELNGGLNPLRVKPKGTLTFGSGDLNLVATQVRLSRDHPNTAKFEPEQGLDPTLDLKLVGNDFQLKLQGRATNWQKNVIIANTGSGDEESLSTTQATEKFESKMKESLLEADGQLAFRKLAGSTLEALMPKIETQGELGKARWRLVSAPRIPNLLSLDPNSDPFKNLANLSVGAEVEIQWGDKIQASVVRKLKESEISTEWTVLYQLNSKLRLLYSCAPSVHPHRIFFEYSASSQK